MSKRWLASADALRVPACLGIMFGLAALALAPVSAQTTPSKAVTVKPAANAKSYKAPRTPWGDPDLQGYLFERIRGTARRWSVRSSSRADASRTSRATNCSKSRKRRTSER